MNAGTKLADLLKQVGELELQIRSQRLRAPEVIVTDDPMGPLECPACHKRPSTWTEIDFTYRLNPGDVDRPEFGGKPIVTFRQTDADFDTWAFACSECGELVRMPPTITVGWD